MFTYICLGTSDIARSVRFYDPVMAALGHARCQTPGEEDFVDLMGWAATRTKARTRWRFGSVNLLTAHLRAVATAPWSHSKPEAGRRWMRFTQQRWRLGV